MRPWFLVLGALGVCLGQSSHLAAQEAPSLSPAPAGSAPWEIAMPRGLPAAPPLYVEDPPPAPCERNPWLDVDFLLGLPFAVRTGLAIYRHKEQALLLEGLVGVDFIIPIAAVGARYRFVAWHGQRSELVIKPGIDAYVGVVPFFFVGVASGIGGDVAFVFHHNGPRHGFEWGVDLGALGIFNGGVVPIVSFILGFNF